VTGGHPLALPPVNHTAPVPRRIRAVLDRHKVVDTTSALYVWEWSDYPQYYIPVDDIDPAVLVDEQAADLVEERGGVLLGVDQEADGGAAQVWAAAGAGGWWLFLAGRGGAGGVEDGVGHCPSGSSSARG